DERAILIDLDDEVAVRARALAHLRAPGRERPIRGPAREADKIAGNDGLLAELVRREHGLPLGTVARAYRLIDVDMVRDVALELRLVGEARLAHDPRDERRGPRVAPARNLTAGLSPGVVVALDDPGAVARHGPVARDRRCHANGFRNLPLERRAQPGIVETAAASAETARRPGAAAPPARARPARGIRLVHDGEAEIGPLLCGDVDDSSARVDDGSGAA